MVLGRENPEVQVLENYNVLGGSEGSGRIVAWLPGKFSFDLVEELKKL
jgi:hypothetical protein